MVSSQLDMDRMDYLNRDSFYTGVSEGVIGFDRILKMIYVMNDQLVIEEKGIYSVEKFLIARRLMYWQVYFHKTVIAAEQLLLKILNETSTELFIKKYYVIKFYFLFYLKLLLMTEVKKHKLTIIEICINSSIIIIIS